MFGYVRPPLSALPEAEQARFRRIYCGLCHTLGQRYGGASRFILNYDLTYLAILLSPPEALTLTVPPVPALAAVHMASLGLLGYTVLLQARALAYDHASVDWKLLLLGYDAGHRRYLTLPALLMGIAVDVVIVFLFLF